MKRVGSARRQAIGALRPAALGVALCVVLSGALAACTLTGVAAPEGAIAHSSQNGQYLGEPGQNAP